MNRLSQMLYWADVLPSLAHLFMFVFGLASIAGAFMFICTLVAKGSGLAYRRYDAQVKVWVDAGRPQGQVPDEFEITGHGTSRSDANIYETCRFSYWFLPLMFSFWSAAFFVPSKDTFYMIAASEAGEQAIATPEFTKVRTLLNQWLDNAIKKDGDDQGK